MKSFAAVVMIEKECRSWGSGSSCSSRVLIVEKLSGCQHEASSHSEELSIFVSRIRVTKKPVRQPDFFANVDDTIAEKESPMRTHLRALAVLFALVAGLGGVSNSSTAARAVAANIHLRKETGHYYTWIPQPLKWEAANAFAGKYSVKHEGTTLSKWHLVTITDSGENDFIFRVVLGESSTERSLAQS